MSNAAGLRALIHERLGIQMPPDKLPMLSGRLQRRMRELGLGSLDEYERHVLAHASDPQELRELAAAVTTNKTDFYREPVQFEHLTTHTLGEQGIGRGKQTSVKVWCAGCSSGEEAYSLSMVLADYGREIPGWDFAVLGTDISSRALDRARQAVYPRGHVAPLPLGLQDRYLLFSRDPSQDEVRIRPELRARVAFRELNFMASDYDVPAFDLVFFRNVAIYFDAPTQRAVLDKLVRRLRVGGHLFLGQSESLTGSVPGLERVGPSVYRNVRAR
jgi:chemotaxis protein methyltransferase CheR